MIAKQVIVIVIVVVIVVMSKRIVSRKVMVTTAFAHFGVRHVLGIVAATIARIHDGHFMKGDSVHCSSIIMTAAAGDVVVAARSGALA